MRRDRVLRAIQPPLGPLAALQILLSPSASAQTPIFRVETRPLWQVDSAFTELAGVQELPGGRLLILDAGGRALYLHDPTAQRVSPIGRLGSGPGEHLLPKLLLPMPRGETGVHDPPNGRVLVLDASGHAIRVVPDRVSQPAGTQALAPVAPSGSDTVGWFYSQAQSAALRPGGTWQAVASAAIERWSPLSAKRDTIGTIPVTLPPGAFVSQGMVAAPAMAVSPFTRVARWAVALDGWVGIVHPSPYSIELIDPAGARRRSGTVNYRPIPLSVADRAAWLAERRRPRFQAVYVGGARAPEIRRVTPHVPEPRRWPAELPPTTDEQPLFDAAGRLWVGRSVAAGARPRYDVFSRAARLIAQVELPAGGRLLGLGTTVLYVVRRDRDDLEYLAAYRMPRLPAR